MDAYRTRYQTQAVETAPPAQLVLMLYDGALAAVTRAEQALTDLARPDRLDAANRELLRAQDIVNELHLSLDHHRGGELATNFALLYDFCLDRLVTANLQKDPARLGSVRTVLAGLRDAWEEACCRGLVAAR